MMEAISDEITVHPYPFPYFIDRRRYGDVFCSNRVISRLVVFEITAAAVASSNMLTTSSVLFDPTRIHTPILLY